MSSEDQNDAVLSDVEEEDEIPIEKFKQLLFQLDREKQARKSAEISKSELQVSFNRLKVLTHEAIKKRDEALKKVDKLNLELTETVNSRNEVVKKLDNVFLELTGTVKLKDEAVKKVDELSLELTETVWKVDKMSLELKETLEVKDEALKKVENLSLELSDVVKLRDEGVVEVRKELEDVMRGKELSRSEIGTAASMLVTGIDRISSRVGKYKNFGAGGLPRSGEFTRGLPAVTYGVITRMEEIVEELLRLVEGADKGRDEVREVLERSNYEIAIEVSRFEAVIGGLREEGERKDGEIERLEKGVEERDGRIAELEDEVTKLRNSEGEHESRTGSLQEKMDLERVLVIDQLDFVGKIHQQMLSVIKVVDPSKSSEMLESLFVAQETDVEGNIRASLAGLESIYELSRFIAEKTRDLVDENKREVKLLNETVAQLVKEKEQVGSLLRTAMSRRMSVGFSSKTNELFKVAENGLRDFGIDYKFSDDINKDRKRDLGGASTTEQQDNEVYALAGAIENIIKQSQLEIIELKHNVEELREESCLLKEQLETHAKELSQLKLRVKELEESERVANDNVEGLMLDIGAAEEEIERWKVAAQEEAAAGKAIEEEYTEQLAAVRLELEEANQAVIQCERKLKFKEGTAVAAMAARDAAENSLRLADMRSTRLREKVEELTHQIQERGSKETSTTGLSRSRYMCWPWEWLGLDFVGSHKQPQSQQESANEMELSEPLL
ncbi:hypothetical protein LIER_41163 [Lithospermum erythrorhizon]|uniref:Paramyosin n=1 Tax=Lithospermum erythrorhizon TaxID=34254 RepID=A0AAV3R6D1_LITER